MRLLKLAIIAKIVLMKVAIIHDWLVTYGGAEVFVEYLLRLFPEAEIFTSVYDAQKLGSHFAGVKIHTSSLQRLPFSKRIYTKLLTLMPKAFESFDLSSFDLVISSSSCCAKGVITSPLTPHAAFIHSPMRYAWDLFFDYKKRSGFVTRFFMDRWMGKVRQWDYISAQRPDVLIANSRYIARRIKKFWARDARVIYLPVDTTRFEGVAARDNTAPYYVAFSRLVSYKRMDLAVSACKALGRKLLVIGSGPELKNLRKLARGADITFLGRVSDKTLAATLRGARALLFCAEEDYGFVPLEAQACGLPVIAFGRGGATETVEEGVTGLYFSEQKAGSLIEAITKFESIETTFDRDAIIAHAKSFTFDNFATQIKAAIEAAKAIAKVQ